MGWKIQYAHKWIDIPHTSYEIFREFRIRESRQTAMIHSKKYYDVDTGKYNADKLETINSYSISDMIDDSVHLHMTYPQTTRIYLPINSNQPEEEQCLKIFNIPKFIPKDNDFDDECLKEKEKKEKKEKQRIQGIQKEIDDLKKRIKEKEIAYEKQTQAAELRLAALFHHTDSPRNMPSMTNIRPNCWKPK